MGVGSGAGTGLDVGEGTAVGTGLSVGEGFAAGTGLGIGEGTAVGAGVDVGPGPDRAMTAASRTGTAVIEGAESCSRRADDPHPATVAVILETMTPKASRTTCFLISLTRMASDRGDAPIV